MIQSLFIFILLKAVRGRNHCLSCWCFFQALLTEINGSFAINLNGDRMLCRIGIGAIMLRVLLNFTFLSALLLSDPWAVFTAPFLKCRLNSADIPAVYVVVIATGITALLSLGLVGFPSLPFPSGAIGNDVVAGWALALWPPRVLTAPPHKQCCVKHVELLHLMYLLSCCLKQLPCFTSSADMSCNLKQRWYGGETKILLLIMILATKLGALLWGSVWFYLCFSLIFISVKCIFPLRHSCC